MLALTVLQPWASLLVLGIKNIENRKWASPKGLRPGSWLAIHAGRLDANAMSPAVQQEIRGRWPGAPEHFALLPRCTFVGAVRIEGYGRYLRKDPKGLCSCRINGTTDEPTCDLRPFCSPWAAGPVCWMTDLAVALPGPKPNWSQRGRLGLWPCPDDVVDALRPLVRKATNTEILRSGRCIALPLVDFSRLPASRPVAP